MSSDALELQEETPSPLQKKRDKCMRYYYRHREEIIEKNRQKRLADPVYVAKMAAKEAAREEKRRVQEQKEAERMQREAEKKQQEEEKVKEREERRRARAVALRAIPAEFPPV
jgi:alpha-galactosidase/6-phospho-beta-glucosidase family protein